MIREWETCEDDGHEHPEDEAFGFCYSNIRDLFVNVAVGNYGHEEEGDRQPATVKPYRMVSMRRLREKRSGCACAYHRIGCSSSSTLLLLYASARSSALLFAQSCARTRSVNVDEARMKAPESGRCDMIQIEAVHQ